MKLRRVLFVPAAFLIVGTLLAFMMVGIRPNTALAFTTVLTEPFDDDSQFTLTSSTDFYSDGSGDFLGISDGAGAGDFGPGSVPSGLKAYTGLTGSFLTGMDLDGDGEPATAILEWTGLNITGLSNLQFSGDFAEFFDSPGDIDSSDFIRIEVQIDAGGYTEILEFRGNGDGSNEVFAVDTDGDNLGDGATLGNAAANFTAAIVGTGATLDLRLSVKVDAGDEDFAADNFLIEEQTSADTAPEISSTNPITGQTNVAINATISLIFNESVDYNPTRFATGVDINCSSSGLQTVTPIGSGTTWTLPHTDFDYSETCMVTVETTDFSDSDTLDPPDNLAADVVFEFTTEAEPLTCPTGVVLNEFIVDHASTDDAEFIEIFGDANTDYSNLTILAIESDPGSSQGNIDDVFTVGTTDANGYWTTGFLNNILENSSTTFMLVCNFTGSSGDDLDADDDGVFDSAPYDALLDDVGYDDGDHVGFGTVLLTSGDGDAGFSRIPNGTDTDAAADWLENENTSPADPSAAAGGEAINTPGAENAIPLAGPDTLYIGELLADSCDPDDDGEHAVVCNFGTETVNMNGWGVGETNTTMSSADTMFIGDTLSEAAGDCDGGIGAAGSCDVAPNECILLISNTEENAYDHWGPALGLTDGPTCSGDAPYPYRTFEFGQPGPSSGDWFDARYNNEGDAMGLFNSIGEPVACVSYGDGNLTFPDADPAACADIFNGGTALGNLPVPKYQSVDTTVEVNGIGEDWGSYQYTQTAFVDAPFGFCSLELDILKVASTTAADPGDTITYTIVITNPTGTPMNALNGGGATLTDTFDAQLTDINCTTPSSGTGGLSGNLLAYSDIFVDAESAETIVCTAVVDPELTCAEVDIDNTADLDYSYIDFMYENDTASSCDTLIDESISSSTGAISATAGCSDDVISIDIEKSTNMADADAAPGPNVNVGDTVTWRYVVRNTGNVTLTNLTITDTVEGVVPTANCSPMVTTLAPNDTTTCTLTGAAVAGQYMNSADVSGISEIDGTSVTTDTDDSHYFGVVPTVPLLVMTKTVSVDGGASFVDADENDATAPDINGGSIASYEITIGHDDASTGAAHDIMIADVLASASLNLVDGSVAVCLDGVEIANASTTDPRVRITAGNDGEGTVGVTYFGSSGGTLQTGVNGNAAIYQTETEFLAQLSDGANFGNAPADHLGATDIPGLTSSTASGMLVNGNSYSFTFYEGNFDTSAGGTNVIAEAAATVGDIDSWAGSTTGDTVGSSFLYEAGTTDQGGASIPAWGYDTDTSISGLGNTVALFDFTASPTAIRTFALDTGDFEGGNAWSNVIAIYRADGTLIDEISFDWPAPNYGDGTEEFIGIGANEDIGYVALFVGEDDDPTTPVNTEFGHDERIAVGNFRFGSSELTIPPGDGLLITETLTIKFDAMVTTTAGIYENTATTDYDDTFGAGGSAGAQLTDTANVEVVEMPSIVIEKATNGEDADTATGPEIGSGMLVTWTYVVTNTGNVTLTSVSVTDDVEGAVMCPESALAPSESMTCQLNGVAVTGQYSNTGTVEGTSPATTVVSDTDVSHYFGLETLTIELSESSVSSGNSTLLAAFTGLLLSTLVAWLIIGRKRILLPH